MILLKVFQNNESMARTATEILKREFLENAKLFTDKKDSLKPLVGDLVLICKETPGLGLITQILSPRRVMVRHKHRGSNIEDEYHSKILALIFRPQTPIYFLQISNEEMPHMLQNFWEKLKKQLTWHSLPTPTSLWNLPTVLAPGNVNVKCWTIIRSAANLAWFFLTTLQLLQT